MSTIPLTVVDTCIARACGSKADGSSRVARDILLALQDTGLSVVFSTELLAEWRQHASRFSKGWLVGMYARRRVKKSLLLEANLKSLLKAIAATSAGENQKEEMGKDAHLIILANKQYSFILSLEKNAVELYLKHLTQPILKNKSGWVRVSNEHSKCLKWIRSSYRNNRPEKAVILTSAN